MSTTIPEPRVVESWPPAPAPVIEARGLTKRYGGGVLALDRLDLAVPAGTVLGLLGPNGAGKTTTVRILTTVIPPSAGSARVLGMEVAERPDDVRAAIGLAGQYAAIDPVLTGRENLTLIGWLTHLPRRERHPRADELLERFGLAEAADRPARTYSGGMRRRLDLAAALIHRPRVLFLDEPTSGLDPASRRDLWDVVRDLVAEGTTVLLTTQYLEEADRLADRIVVIDRGRSIAEGTAAQLKARLGSTVLELGMADAQSAERARALFRERGEWPVGGEGQQVELTAAEGGRALIGAARMLDAAGLEPATVGVREPTLDDVFLSLTGNATAGQEES